MKKIYLGLIIVLLASPIIRAQTISAFKYLNSGSSVGNSISVDDTGNFFIACEFEGTIDCDPDAGVYNIDSKGYFDALVCKFNPSGELVWAKSFGEEDDDRAISIAVDKNGNVYALGYFQGTIDFDPGDGIFNMTASATSDLFLVKLDNDGIFIWAKQITGVVSNQVISGSSTSRGRSLALDSLNNPVIVGYFYGTTDMDPSASVYNLTGGSSMSTFILKLDPDGNFTWAKQFSGSGLGGADYVVSDKFNNLYISGIFQSTIDFDPGDPEYLMTSVGFGGTPNECFLTKLDALGNFVWAKQMGGLGKALAIDPSGSHVYVSGIMGATVDVNPGTDVLNFTAKHSDVFTTKLTADGDFTWSVQFKGTISSSSNTYDLSIDNSSNVHILGGSWGTVDFDPGIGSVTSSGDYYVMLNAAGEFVSKNNYSWNYVKMVLNTSGKYYFTGASNLLFIGGDLPAINVNPGIIGYPNPASDVLIINCEGLDQENLEVYLFSSSGELVKKESVGSFLNMITIDNMNNGIYFVQLRSSEELIYEGRIVVQK